MKIIVLIILMAMLSSCVEEIDFVGSNESFESALVIEATITNELKQQQINLSRTFAIEEDGPNPESGAIITIESSQGGFSFSEIEPGIYLSDATFEAQSNVDYQLKITTNNGKNYFSTLTQLPQVTEINNLYALRESDGLAMFVDSFDPTGNSKYYRYTFEETYKIIAPKWTTEEIVLLNPLTCSIELRDRTQEEKTCYNTVASLNINLKTTAGLLEDRVTKHLIRFINSDDFILTWRYSIIVRQFVQSIEAYTFYKILDDFSDTGSLFSQAQTGFISGNIFSEENTKEKVVGYFDVSSVSEKRIFFNYEDFYPELPKPEFPFYCEPRELERINDFFACGTLISSLTLDKVAYWSGASNVQDTTFFDDGTIIIDTITIGPYNMVTKACGNCTELGSNIVPDFWEE